jgi:flagellar assembly protein FliH
MNSQTAWERWELASFDQVPPPAVLAAGNEVEAEPAVDELAAIRRRAAEEGHQAGYAAGQTAAREEAARLQRAADGLDQALAELDQQVADELLALAVEIARQVVRREVSAHPEVLLGVVHEALEQLPHQHAAIYLNPEDTSLVRSHLGDSLAHAGHRIFEAPSLKPGDCLVEVGGSQIDATVATRWRRVVESLGIESAWEQREEREQP